MAFTDINSEDRLVQKTFAEHLRDKLGWESVYAWNTEVFGTLHVWQQCASGIFAGEASAA